MINLHERIGPGRDRTCDPWICNQTRICCQTRFRLRYAALYSLSDDKQADVIDAFNTTSRYLENILNINNFYFDNMVSQKYPSELLLNKANTSDTEAAFKTCICQFLMILFLPKVMINVTTLILKLSSSHF